MFFRYAFSLTAHRIFSEIKHLKNAVNTGMGMQLPLFRHNFETFRWLLEQQTLLNIRMLLANSCVVLKAHVLVIPLQPGAPQEHATEVLNISLTVPKQLAGFG